MKLTTLTLLTALLFCLLNSGCSPDQDNPLSETEPSELVQKRVSTLSDLHAAIEAGKDTEDADLFYQPGYVHNPIVGCDTLITDLVVGYGPYNVKVGDVFITQTATHLYFIVKPFSGLKIQSLSLHEAEGLNNIPLDKDGTPDYSSFQMGQDYQYPVAKSSYGIPMNLLNPCQAYSLHIDLVTLSNQSNYIGWDAWAWGHDLGTGFGMELCVPSCGAIISN